MSNDKIPARHFTRQQVADYVVRVYTGEDGSQVRVSEVTLLKGFVSPTWFVSFWIIYNPGSEFESRFHSRVVVTEYRRNIPERSWELCLPPDFSLPDGADAVQGENALLRARLAAEEKEFLAHFPDVE